MVRYLRPLVQTGPRPGPGALCLAGGWTWFDRVEVLTRRGAPETLHVRDLDETELAPLIAPRAALGGLALDRPRLMGILNVTPDSFSDGGLYFDPAAARAQARAMVEGGADILDVGGESTRPGAETVAVSEEIARVAPVIAAIRAAWDGPISIDTRKATVARAALAAGADLINDVSALAFDPAMAEVAAASGAPLCLMHARGDPATMQDDPRYDDVLLDVYDHLAARVAHAEAAGIHRSRILVDPGIGFGKTVAHNLTLLANLSLFHGLGCGILLGASRKRFIATLGNAAGGEARMPGSVAVALWGVAQGVQVMRVHDMAQTRQALTLWQAASKGVRE
jgi:dihydropteroate synthase